MSIACQYNPGFIRREIQTRYDSYMSGKSLLLGVLLADTELAPLMDAPLADAEQAYNAVAEPWPKKTRNLIKGIARELLFETYAADNHHNNALPLLASMAAKMDPSIDATALYISGFGRNACIVSALRVGNNERSAGSTIVTPERAMAYANIVGGLVIVDPDFGLGDITGPTPDLAVADLSYEQAEQSLLRFTRATGPSVGSVATA